MPPLLWCFYRLRAMSAGEVALHARKKLRQFVDARRERDWGSTRLEATGSFPSLPEPDQAPEVLRKALRRDVEEILAGRWKAFGHLDLKVDDPPKWHCDYLVGKDLATTESAFTLDHRALPDGADVKLIWELSRWHQLVRLAMAAYVLGDERAGEKCVLWLEDWVKRNPPYRGWNWTSALEVGMRLIQFTWIDALLGTPTPGSATENAIAPSSALELRLERLRYQILSAHAWYAWRHKSFGSSANNHLIGELAGLIVATTRWPALARWGAPLAELQCRWEHEVLSQFAEDGGNKEQALNYHLFSWEFCWQAWMALEKAGRRVSPPVQQRLALAARFFSEVQMAADPWDYGDSDNAFVTPFFASEQNAMREWHCWFEKGEAPPAIAYWLGCPPTDSPSLKRPGPQWAVMRGDWDLYPESGIALCQSGLWWLRWDLSPLGYGATAAHGHLDALHLSIWFRGVAIVIDPGTGAYYAQPSLRTWLASRAAHNGPCPIGLEYPRRLGPFLWQRHHQRPVLTVTGNVAVGSLALPQGILFRAIRNLDQRSAWEVTDRFEPRWAAAAADFTVRWQFPPGTRVKRISERKFSAHRADIAVMIEVDDNWAVVELIESVAGDGRTLVSLTDTKVLEGIVSPAFRRICRAPYLKLVARPGDKPCVFSTTFQTSSRS